MQSATLERSETSHQMERDGLLDHISYLEDCRARAADYIGLAVAQNLLPLFEATEILALLWEAKEESEARRYGTIDNDTEDEGGSHG